MAHHRVDRRRKDGGSAAAGEWLYGRNAVRESLRAGRRRFYALRVASGMPANEAVDEILALAEAVGLPVESVDRRILDDQTLGANHQGVALSCGRYPYTRLADALTSSAAAAGAPLALVLDSLQDPQNVGTLLRTAEAVGVTVVVVTEHRAAGITPAAVNASSGAVEHLRVAMEANVAQSLRALKAAGFWVVGLEATAEARLIWDVPLTGPLALVVGSEAQGIRRLVLQQCDFIARLPLAGRIESLNAAVAGSVSLYEVLHARSAGQE